MHRLVTFRGFSLLTCSLLVAVAAVAAPAPLYKPDDTVWFGLSGWHKPNTLSGYLKYNRTGRGSTITIPGSRKDNHVYSASIVRDIEGDFQLKVRVSGNFDPIERGSRAAGVIIRSENYQLSVIRVTDANRSKFETEAWLEKVNQRIYRPNVIPMDNEGFVQLERRGDKLMAKVSPDGTNWTRISEKYLGVVAGKLPNKLKIGIVAKSEGKADFKAVFDQFKLTQPSK